MGRNDLHCVFMGSGDAFEDMVELSKELGLDDMVEFTGRVSDEFVQTASRLPMCACHQTRAAR